jgi:hypothetical protein
LILQESALPDSGIFISMQFSAAENSAAGKAAEIPQN